MTLLSATPAEIKRFMSFVEILPNGCWFWTGARSRGKGNKKWYGTFWWNAQKGSVRAHRFVCEQIKGEPLPDNHHRDHVCRFSLCVNPEHLEVLHKDENQRRRHSPGPRMTLHYEYVAGELTLSLKIISSDVVIEFTPAENEPIVSSNRTGELENDQSNRPHPLPLRW